MHIQSIKFRLVFAAKAQKQLDSLCPKDRKQYDKAFEYFANHGSTYRSLRTHRYRCKDGELWSSSASMAKRFYWRYMEDMSIICVFVNISYPDYCSKLYSPKSFERDRRG